MKKKLQLNELQINSFVTTVKHSQIQGGKQTAADCATDHCTPPVLLSQNVDCPIITRLRDYCFNIAISDIPCQVYTKEICVNSQLLTNCAC